MDFLLLDYISDYSVCPRPLHQVFDFSSFRFLGFRFFGFSGFWVFRFLGFQVFRTVRILCVSLHKLKSFPVGGGGWSTK